LFYQAILGHPEVLAQTIEASFKTLKRQSKLPLVWWGCCVFGWAYFKLPKKVV
jgi:hypothetical protein